MVGIHWQYSPHIPNVRMLQTIHQLLSGRSRPSSAWRRPDSSRTTGHWLAWVERHWVIVTPIWKRVASPMIDVHIDVENSTMCR